ncbi:carboxymuconolactone decarboxylase family protein [Myxococcota bacterium]|nr:carboxymuconolactone decarboxylase family protein [Myxococcota bacterium]
MKLDKPRIRPLREEEWPPDARGVRERLVSDGQVLNIYSTMAHHPDLLRRWLVFGNHVLLKSTLPPRDREIAILRIGWLCGSEYEWGQHVVIGKREGLGEEEFQRIAAGPDAEGWDSFESALVSAVDELHSDAMISEGTWSSLTEHYNVQQMLDLILTVGQYNLVSMVLNSTGVQLEDGVDGFPGS